LLLNLLMDYVEYVKMNAVHSLLPRFLGLYKVKLPGQPRKFMTVMPNIFRVDPNSSVMLYERYDLKGSLYKRYVDLGSKDEDADAAPGALDGSSSSPVHSRGSSGSAAVSSTSRLMPLDSPARKPITTVLKDLNFCPNHGHRKKAPPQRPDHSAEAAIMAKNYKAFGLLDEDDEDEDEGDEGALPGSALSSARGLEFMDPSDRDSIASATSHDNCRKIHLGEDRRAVFLINIENDVRWLCERNIMDYSLLLGVGTCRISEINAQSRKARRKRRLAGEKRLGELQKMMASQDEEDAAHRETQTEFSGPSLSAASVDSIASGGSSVRGLAVSLPPLTQTSSPPLSPSPPSPPPDTPPSPPPPPVTDPQPPVPKEATSPTGLSISPLSDLLEEDDGLSLEDKVELENLLSQATKLTPQQTVRVQKLMTRSSTTASTLEGAARASKTRSTTIGSSEYAKSSRGHLFTEPEEEDESSDEESDTGVEVSYWQRQIGGISAHRPPREEDDREQDPASPGEASAAASEESDAVIEWYTFGIIDVLQKYNMKKKAEHVVKVTAMGNDRNAVSAVEPNFYAKRFLDFMSKHTA